MAGLHQEAWQDVDTAVYLNEEQASISRESNDVYPKIGSLGWIRPCLFTILSPIQNIWAIATAVLNSIQVGQQQAVASTIVIMELTVHPWRNRQPKCCSPI